MERSDYDVNTGVCQEGSPTSLPTIKVLTPGSMFQKFNKQEADASTLYLLEKQSPIIKTPGNASDPLYMPRTGPSRIVPDRPTPSDSPIESWTQNLSRTTPQTETREILPTRPTPENESPIGETPNSSGKLRYFSKKLQRNVTVSRGSKKTLSSISRKKKTLSTVSNNKQRLITAMLGIAPLESGSGSVNPNYFQNSESNLENESD